jgi:pyruvate kinase
MEARLLALPKAASLHDEVSALRDELRAAEVELAHVLDAVPPAARPSALNLVHYLALRRQDRRVLQDRLADLGLSSLGRCEGAVLATVEAVLTLLALVEGRERPAPRERAAQLDRQAGRQCLEQRTTALLGPAPAQRATRILVTLPSEAATDAALVRRLVEGGMDAARINCAHDDAIAWRKMAGHVRQAARDAGRSCQVLMDLGGPKLRTGAVGGDGQPIKWGPRRDPMGQILEPARISLVAEPARSRRPPGLPALAVPGEWLAELTPGQVLELTDARGKRRRLLVGAEHERVRACSSEQTSYLAAGEHVRLKAKDGDAVQARVLPPPPSERRLSLGRGELLTLTRSREPGRPAERLDLEHTIPARLPCTLPEVFASVHVGERVFLDDGKIGGVIEAATPDELQVRLSSMPSAITRLGADKGINLPDSSLDVPALTADDLADLDAVVGLADLVGLSFVRRPQDVEQLRAELERRGGSHLGIVLKIETRAAFEALPSLLFAALGAPTVGVMIARGDLAVECGYQRLAELQEEILWLCEAAHVPVIWATQVLESLAKHGEPSRAEITDAAMGERAECVMLNKGDFMERAVTVLDDILTRMAPHQDKKMAMLRPLHVSVTSIAGLAASRRA